MPARTVSSSALRLAALLAAVLLALAPPALATDSSWKVDTAGNWSSATNWTAGVPDAIGAIARLTFNITAPRTVTTSGQTVGSLYLNDDNYGYTLAGLGLTLYASYYGSGPALIQSDGGTGVTHTISAPLALNNNTTVAVNSGTLQISGIISGGDDITKTGAGTLTLTAVNTYSGQTTVSGGTLNVTGTIFSTGNSTVTVSGGSLNVQAGGKVSDYFGTLGNNSGSTGTATVTGAGSTWASSNALSVGNLGNGTLNIQAGGQVSSSGGSIGNGSGSTGTATVTGAGSTWTNSGSFNVGNYGNGTLNIQAGGQVISSNVNSYSNIGRYSGSTGAVTVTGAGSTWTNSGHLFVGPNGSGTLTVTDGGRVTVGTLYASPGDLLGDGTITVTHGAVLDTDLVFDAIHGTTQTRAFGAGGTLNLSVTSGGNLGAGYKGTGTLRIADGVTVAAYFGFLGYNSGSTGAATVTGPGSKWGNDADLHVGSSGNGTLNIEAGGQVSNRDGYIGRNTGATGTVTVTGTGSKWTNSGSLSVGPYGSGTLTVADGGLVSAGTLYASPSDLFGDGTITVTKGAILDTDLVFDAAHGTTQTLAFGTGGTLNLTVTSAGTLGAGFKGLGTLRIADGLTVTSYYGYLGDYSGSTGTATVIGAGSKWANSKSILVGLNGNGTMNIQAGGQVTNTDGYLGYRPSSTGTVTVDGIGSAWNNTGSLNVGGDGYIAGGLGSMTVQNGGQLTVGGTLKLWKADSAVTVNGGTLVAGALVGTTGNVRITDPASGTALTVGSAATNTFSGTIVNDTGPGSLKKVGSGVQTLGGVNSYTGSTTIAAGTLKLAATSAMATSLFDIAAGATLDVRDFLGGYTLPPGAGLMGGGTVLGDLVVSGPVAPGSSPGILSVEDIIFAAGSTLQVELGGPARGTEYDVLAASGNIGIEGGSALAVTLINAFAPQEGDAFDILDFAALGGRFGTPTLPALGGDLAWNTDGLYTSGVIQVVPEPASAALLLAGLAGILLRFRRGAAAKTAD